MEFPSALLNELISRISYSQSHRCRVMVIYFVLFLTSAAGVYRGSTQLDFRCIFPSPDIHEPLSVRKIDNPPCDIPTKMSKNPITEVCLIHIKDPSTPEDAIWASSISTWKNCPGFRYIYTGSSVEDGTKARMFLSNSPFSTLFVLALAKVPEKVAVDMSERGSILRPRRHP